MCTDLAFVANMNLVANLEIPLLLLLPRIDVPWWLLLCLLIHFPLAPGPPVLPQTDFPLMLHCPSADPSLVPPSLSAVEERLHHHLSGSLL